MVRNVFLVCLFVHLVQLQSFGNVCLLNPRDFYNLLNVLSVGLFLYMIIPEVVFCRSIDMITEINFVSLKSPCLLGPKKASY